MQRHRTRFETVSCSLLDMLGEEYIEAVCEAYAYLDGEDVRNLRNLAAHSIDFFPEGLQDRLISLLPQVGEKVLRNPVERTPKGAASRNFRAATHVEMAPLSGLGYYRIGENGILYLITKSEHYQTPLGHGFPGFQLVERARRLGIPNATHNNTRGHITRLLEEELVRAVNFQAGSSNPALPELLESDSPRVINRVLNLETGSLAVEAALKMILTRFYRAQDDGPAPSHEGKIPVFMVMGNDEGFVQANYHGTTILTQTMRGMWPKLTDSLSQKGIYHIAPIRPNHIEDVHQCLAAYDQGASKVAGFFHEIVMMNYGARLLNKAFLNEVYDLCRAHDIPTVADEIQTCLWAPDFFLFKEYGIKPDFVAVGKGLTNGEYAASRVLFSSQMDSLPQFGALVTNGQEELASLTYLISMKWTGANAETIARVGEYYEERLAEFALKQRHYVASVDGYRHMSSLRFNGLEPAREFSHAINRLGLDMSVQTYKSNCPPTVLTKLPLIAGHETVDLVLEKMDLAMASVKA